MRVTYLIIRRYLNLNFKFFKPIIIYVVFGLIYAIKCLGFDDMNVIHTITVITQAYFI